MILNGERIGPVEKATKEELSCWDPNQPDGIDHSREVRGRARRKRMKSINVEELIIALLGSHIQSI